MARSKAASPATSLSSPASPDASARIPAPNGYSVALEGDRVVAFNPKGARLASIPKDLKESEAVEQLQELVGWLERHARGCRDQVETWMIRSLPVPTAVLKELWADPAWRAVLENTIVLGVDEAGRSEVADGGFLKAVEPVRGLGLLSLDRESVWVQPAALLIPHPILLPELADWRELALELGVSQQLSQLMRETFERSRKYEESPDAEARVTAFANGHFAQLNHALAACRSLGYRVRGGYACCRVFEANRMVEARFWIGSEDPMWETSTDELLWVDTEDKTLTFAQVGPIAWSEGMRMASSLFARRQLEKESDDA